MEGTEMDSREGDGEEDSDTLDPKVKEELDRLNQASCDINKLENELDEARSKFSSTRNDSTQQLNTLTRKIKTSVIKKARPYYEANEKARKAQEEALKAARQFQSATGIHRAAKETISLAEEKLCAESGRVLTSEWQEMFNHATMRLMDAEKEKRRSEEEHQIKSQIFSEAEKHMQNEEKKHKRSISRARPYFERKAELQTKLEMLKVAVEALQDAVTESKRKYSKALRNLEAISNKEHEKRKVKLHLYLPREPGVGAETDTTDHPGSSCLRTSFDVPDTPYLDQASFDPETAYSDCDADEEENNDDENSSDVWEPSSDVKFNFTQEANGDHKEIAVSDPGIYGGNPILLHVKSSKSLSSLDSISEERPVVIGQYRVSEEDSSCSTVNIQVVPKLEISSQTDCQESVGCNDEIVGHARNGQCDGAGSQELLCPPAIDESEQSSDTNTSVQTKGSLVNKSSEKFADNNENGSKGKCISEGEYKHRQVNVNLRTVEAFIENTFPEEKPTDQIADLNSESKITSLEQLQLRDSDMILHADVDTITLEEIVPRLERNRNSPKTSNLNFSSGDQLTENLLPGKSDAEVFV